MKFRILLALAFIVFSITLLAFPSMLLKGVGYIEWKILHGQTSKLYRDKNYPEALLVVKHELKVAKEKIDPEHLKVAQSLDYLGLIYDKTGEDDKSETAFNHALKIKKKQLSPNHLFVANTSNNLGELFIKQKKYNKAEKFLQQAYEIRKNKLGLNHIKVATSLNNLGALYFYEKKYIKAERLHKRALAIRKKKLGFYSSAVEVSLHNLAEVSWDLDKYDEALTFFLQSLDILQTLKRPKNNYMAKELHKIAWLYYRQGNYNKTLRNESYKKAEDYYLQALSIKENLFPANHPSIISTLENLASLYRKTNQVSKAGELEERINKAKN